MRPVSSAVTGYNKKAHNVTTDDKVWIGQQGKQSGPYTEAEVRRRRADGRLGAETMAWHSGLADWVTLDSLFPPTVSDAVPPPLATSFSSASFSSASPTPRAGQAPLSLHVPVVGPGTPPKTPKGTRRTTDPLAAALSVAGPALQAHQADDGECERANIPEPPSLHWGLLMLISVLTLGIFGLIWSFIQAKWVSKIDRSSNATVLLVFATACSVVGYSLYMSGTSPNGVGDSDLGAIGGLLLIGYWILYLTAYFSMATSMRRQLTAIGLPVQIGGVTLFFFTKYYFQAQLSWAARWKRTGKTDPKASKGIFWALWAALPGIAILAAIMIPAYQNYSTRSQVLQAATLASGSKTAIAEYYSENGTFPTDDSAAGLSQGDTTSSPYVSSVSSSQGRITVVFNNKASPELRDKLLVLAPSVQEGTIRWSCTDSTVPDRDLPSSCR